MSFCLQLSFLNDFQNFIFINTIQNFSNQNNNKRQSFDVMFNNMVVMTTTLHSIRVKYKQYVSQNT
jgi:hypothetical protein